MKPFAGRYAYGLAAISSGICAFAWHNFSAIGVIPHRAIFVYILAIIEIVGGVAVQSQRTARAGAAALGAVYLAFAFLGVPFIVRHPQIYNGFGNFFEQFSFVSAALILYACSSRASARAASLAKIGYYSFGICLISFALEQFFYLSATASLVPKWIPPGQMFWARATTAAFALAAVALLAGFMAPLASRLSAAMIVGFGLLVWVPVLFADPHHFENWSETIETFGIAASAWIVAEYVGHRRAADQAFARPD
jgi:hypothetical protein